MEKQLKILMLEDVEDDAELVDRLFAKEKIAFERLRVDTQAAYEEALDSYKPDLILSDHALPQFNSIEALIIKQEKKLDVPFIIVTGAVSEEFAVNCLKRGADDYVLKSNLSRLPSSINHSLNEYRQARIRREQEVTLRKKNEELLKVNKELDAFVYSISHNLRAPVASIIGVTNLVKLDHAKGTPHLYCELIEKSALKLDRTVKEILHYSRNSRTELLIAKINLKELCNECFNQLDYLEGMREVEMEVDIKGEGSFYSDRYRLGTLMTNLLTNAIKYKDVRKSRSLITIKGIVSPTQLTLNILDNGEGIRPNVLPNVFTMFYRGNENSDGDGLGLYIGKEMVEKLKGTIDIQSEYGQWTNVVLVLPNLA